MMMQKKGMAPGIHPGVAAIHGILKAVQDMDMKTAKNKLDSIKAPMAAEEDQESPMDEAMESPGHQDLEGMLGTEKHKGMPQVGEEETDEGSMPPKEGMDMVNQMVQSHGMPPLPGAGGEDDDDEMDLSGAQKMKGLNAMGKGKPIGRLEALKATIIKAPKGMMR